ncbi:unnamed protein product [Amoebophrya sp. A25]|nr:unnamed protein product [Amoebophrya sp. A25]|eukprot:GSA25T00007503001.1
MSRKKARLDHLSIDLEEFAIVAHYTTSEDDRIHTKKVRLPKDFISTEIPDLAQEVVEKCKYIPNGKVQEVQQLMQEMLAKSKSRSKESAQVQQQLAAKHQQLMRQQPKQQGAPAFTTNLEKILPQANWGDLDEYSDLLYEEKMELKVRGAKCLLRVCLDARNLQLLAKDESLLGVLSRELRENYKKSHDLATAISSIFLCFSAFTVFHSTLGQHQCGDASLRILEYETKRYQIRSQEREHYLQMLQNNPPEEERKRLQKEEKKFQHQVLRQNKLLHTCLHILINLAEDIFIEKKMVNRMLVRMVCQLLDRSMEELLYVALLFLKKLSIFEENKEVMIRDCRVVPRLVQLAHHQSAFIALLALRVLYNLSFDDQILSFSESGELFQQLVDLLKHPPFRQIVLKLLYQFTRDERCKSLLTYHQDCIVMLLQLTVHFPDVRLGQDLVALGINLALHARAAELMVVCQLRSSRGEPEFLWPQVILRLLKTRDPLLCRMVRYCCSHQNVRQLIQTLMSSDQVRMSRWIHELLRASTSQNASTSQESDFLVEVLGLLANMENAGVPWAELCDEEGLIDLLHRQLVVGFAEDDVRLEAVMVVQLVAREGPAHHLLCDKFQLVLTELLSEKQDDDDMVLQLLYTFECMALHDELREILLLEESQLIPSIIDLMRIRTAAPIKHQASRTLDTICTLAAVAAQQGANAAAHVGWRERIAALKFDVHNSAWLNEVRGSNIVDSGGDWGSQYGHLAQWEVEKSLGPALQWDIDAVLRERDWTGEA